MTRIFRSKIFWLIFIFLLIGGAALAQYLIVNQKIEYVTEEVRLGDIVQTVTATGQIKSATDIELNFKTTGRLSELNVAVGSKVEKGNILARLRDADLRIDVDKAEANLLEAQANLQKIQAGSTGAEIKVTEAAFDQAVIALENAKSELESTKSIYGQALDNSKDNLLIDIKSSLSKASVSLQEVRDTLYFENDSNNFNTSNFGLEQEVNQEYNDSLEKVAIANEAYSQAIVNKTSLKIDLASDRALSALVSTQELLSDLSNLLNYVVTNATLTLSDVSALKSTISTELTTTNSSIDTVQGSAQDLADAQITLDTKVVTATNSVSAAQKALAKAEADLDFAKAPARQEDVLLAQAKVSRARADLASAEEKLLDTIIQAPQDGVITDINYDLSEQTSLSQAVIEMAADDNFKIEVDIPESDIAKVETGDMVNVTLDAFTEDDIFKAIVTTIDPAETEIQDVIYFNVTVLLVDDQPSEVLELLPKIKPGMTANIEISTDEKRDVVIIPFRAIRDDAGKRYVEVLENDQPKRVDVEVGLRGDEGELEIISGLKAGQLVITSVREN